MKKITILNLVIAFAFILGACGTSNNVVNNHLISKRKYTKGFHVNKRSNLKSDKSEGEILVLKEDKSKESQKPMRTNSIQKTEKSDLGKQQLTALQTNESIASQDKEERKSYSAGLMDGTSQESSSRIEVKKENENKLNEIDHSTEATKNKTQSSSPDLGDPLMLILAIILALFLPPLAILIFKGISTWFWVDLLLFIIGIGGFFLLPGLGWACAVAAVVIAFLVIFDII